MASSSGASRVVAQTGQTAPKPQALQAAVDSKDTTAIFNLLNQTPRDERGPMAALLVLVLANLVVAENQNQTQASPN